MKYIKRFNESDSWAGSLYAYGYPEPTGFTQQHSPQETAYPLKPTTQYKCNKCDSEFFIIEGDKIICPVCKYENANKIEYVKEVRKIKLNDFTFEEIEDIRDCLVELSDIGFELEQLYTTQFEGDKVLISLTKAVKKQENLSYNSKSLLGIITIYFDRNEIVKSTKSLFIDEYLKINYKLTEICDEIGHKLINLLHYYTGKLHIEHYNGELVITFILRKDDKKFEAYDPKQEYINDIISQFQIYNIRPVVLNKLLDFYSDEIKDGYENDKPPKDFVDSKVKEMELDNSKGFMQQMGSRGYNQTIKYL